jgi:hypothetical protein
MKVRFREWDCELQFRTYSNGRTALLLANAKGGDDIAVATVNVPGVPLAANQVLVKDYSENHGMLAALEAAGIVRATGVRVQTGHASIPVCELLVEPPGKVHGRSSARRKDRDIEPER